MLLGRYQEDCHVLTHAQIFGRTRNDGSLSWVELLSAQECDATMMLLKTKAWTIIID